MGNATLGAPSSQKAYATGDAYTQAGAVSVLRWSSWRTVIPFCTGVCQGWGQDGLCVYGIAYSDT